MSGDEADDWRRLLEELVSTMAQARVVVEQSQVILLEHARLRAHELEVREREADAARLRAQAEIRIAEDAARRQGDRDEAARQWHAQLVAAARSGLSYPPVQGVIIALAGAATAAITWWASRWTSPGGTP